MDSERMTRILLEVAINGTTSSPADTPEDAAMRKKMADDCAAIRAKGGMIDIPGEFP